jgi:hypothetical protein
MHGTDDYIGRLHLLVIAEIAKIEEGHVNKANKRYKIGSTVIN